VPAGKEGTANDPFASVTAEYRKPVSLFSTVTAAPGTNAPEESTTVPDKLDVELICAAAGKAQNSTTESSRIASTRM